MNKIKTIKIKNEDGSISEESYSIAADALNIDMTNGKNVQETIGTIDVDQDGDIAAQLNKKINKSDIIDNLNSSDNNKVLSAKQGKVLNEAVVAANLDIQKKMYYFNTIENMKVADLQAGDTCQTLGYYEENDGGAGLYKIVDDDILVDDGGNIHELENGLKAELIIEDGITNVKQFGAKGNGLSDDTEILQNCLDKNETGTIYFPEGEYLIKSTLNFKCNIKMEQNTRIITDNTNINYLMLFNSEISATTLNELSKGKILSGGILDGKGIVSKLLGVSNYMGLTIENMRFENPKEFGLVTRNTGNLSAELLVNNCYFYNNYNLYQNKPTGIYNNSGDNIFTNITMFNMYIGVDTLSGYFENIHPWLSKSELVDGSIAFKCNGNVSLISCYADTYEKSFNNIGENLLRLVNCNVLYNESVYNISNPPYVIYTTSTNSNIITMNLSVINNIEGCIFINQISNSYFNNTFFGGSKEVNKQYYVSNGYNNMIKSLTDNTDVRTLESGCYTNQNQNLINFIPNISNTYGELLVFKNRIYDLLIYISHNSPNDIYYCIGANGGTWRNWRKVANSTEITV